MRQNLTQTEIQQIEEHLLQKLERLNVTGRITPGMIEESDVPILQKIHQKVYGYSIDQGCPGCVADAMRLILNVYREDKKRMAEPEPQPEEPQATTEAQIIQEVPEKDPTAQPVDADPGILEKVAQGIQNVANYLSGARGKEEANNG